jgi:hypothetical protein
MDVTLTDDLRTAPAGDPETLTEAGTPVTASSPGATLPLSTGAALGEEVAPELLADLDHPNLVLSDGYVGPERRNAGFRARVRRATFGQRRSLLRVELLVSMVVAVLVIASILVIGVGGHGSEPARATAPVHAASDAPELRAASRPLTSLRHTATTPVTTPATTPVAATTPTTAAPAAPVATAPAAAPPTTTVPAAAPVAVAPTTTTPAAAATTPAQLGAEALTLVRYPWQRIPGYTIQFLPIADAPEPGFYGNTTFTWGHAGGTSVLYVYPGETVQRLAAITAFEIGHEVDAAGVEPAGGEAQIENILGIHPTSWAPDCDCAEQGFLSGWYAAAFSNAWSPGVGAWSTVAPEPSGAVLTAVEPWLNPAIS